MHQPVLRACTNTSLAWCCISCCGASTIPAVDVHLNSVHILENMEFGNFKNYLNMLYTIYPKIIAPFVAETWLLQCYYATNKTRTIGSFLRISQPMMAMNWLTKGLDTNFRRNGRESGCINFLRTTLTLCKQTCTQLRQVPNSQTCTQLRPIPNSQTCTQLRYLSNSQTSTQLRHVSNSRTYKYTVRIEKRTKDEPPFESVKGEVLAGQEVSEGGVQELVGRAHQAQHLGSSGETM
jgi:hypothetical protein